MRAVQAVSSPLWSADEIVPTAKGFEMMTAVPKWTLKRIPRNESQSLNRRTGRGRPVSNLARYPKYTTQREYFHAVKIPFISKDCAAILVFVKGGTPYFNAETVNIWPCGADRG